MNPGMVRNSAIWKNIERRALYAVHKKIILRYLLNRLSE